MVRPACILFAFSAFLTAAVLTADESPVAKEAKQVKPLDVGEQVPDVTLQTIEGEDVPLASFHKDRPLVVVFYRGSWCPFCTRHTQELIKAYPQIRELGAELVAISPDSPDNAKESVQETKVPFPILSDADVSAARAFGLAFEVDGETLKRYAGFGIDLEKASGYKHHALPVPAVFIVDKGGEIAFRHYNPDYRERLEATRIVAELQELPAE